MINSKYLPIFFWTFQKLFDGPGKCDWHFSPHFVLHQELIGSEVLFLLIIKPSSSDFFPVAHGKSIFTNWNKQERKSVSNLSGSLQAHHTNKFWFSDSWIWLVSKIKLSSNVKKCFLYICWCLSFLCKLAADKLSLSQSFLDS